MRELRNAIERACLLSQQRWIDPALLASADAEPAVPLPEAGTPAPQLRLEEFLRDPARAYIQRALAHHDGQITATAEALGISRKSLWERMKRLGIQ